MQRPYPRFIAPKKLIKEFDKLQTSKFSLLCASIVKEFDSLQ